MWKKPERFRRLSYLAIAWIMALLFVMRFGLDGYGKVRLLDYVHGKAHRPFAYRALVPGVIGFVETNTPIDVQQQCNVIATDLLNLPRPVDQNPNELEKTERAVFSANVFFLITVSCYFGFQTALRRLILHFYPDGRNGVTPQIAAIAPVGAMALVPLFFQYFNYLYDPASLCLFTLALLLLVRNHPLFYLVLGLAAANKETALLLLPLFAVYHFRTMPLPKLAGHLVLQGAIYGGIKTLIFRHFAANPGVVVEEHWADHNSQLVTAPYFWVFIAFMTILMTGAYFVTRDTGEKPAFLRIALPVIFIPQFAMGLWIGYIDEFRIFYESFPLIFMMMLPTILRAAGIVETPAPAPEAVAETRGSALPEVQAEKLAA